jgi:hypothetical protein
VQRKQYSEKLPYSMYLGLGLYLQSEAQKLIGKHDLHEPDRLLTSLNEYEHLARVVRLCIAHFFRNITKCNVSESVRNLMRSLVCIEHPDWDNTLQRIQIEGGTAGASECCFSTWDVILNCPDWVSDKIRSKFAFPAICWAKSFIPKSIWQVGDSSRTHPRHLVTSLRNGKLRKFDGKA